MYEVQSIQGDYLTCRTLSMDSSGGRTVGSADILIAKPYELRESIIQQSIDGRTVNYSYTDGYKDAGMNVLTRVRTANDGVITEDQIVIPRWLIKDIGDVDPVLDKSVIYAVDATGTGVFEITDPGPPIVYGGEITKLALPDGRHWARLYKSYTGGINP